MDTQIVITDTPNALILAGQAANQAAADGVFADFRARKAANTIRRIDADLNLFAYFLRSAGVQVGNLAEDPQAWKGVTWGLVEAWVQWQLTEGFATGSINVRLSSIKSYTGLAFKAGALSQEAYALIRLVSGYSHKEAVHLDEKRQNTGIPTRKGAKKATAVPVTLEQAQSLKRQPNTPQGRRDALLMRLLLDHGLRVGEVAGLQVTDFDLQAGELRFYRPKVNLTQTHKLSADTLRAAKSYFKRDALASGPLLRASRKDGSLGHAGMSERALTGRVRLLGAAVGIKGLSAHDCRHYWATRAARNGTPIDRLQDAGGWSSPSMPLRYVEAAVIANTGVLL